MGNNAENSATVSKKGCQSPGQCWRTVDGGAVLYRVVTVCEQQSNYAWSKRLLAEGISDLTPHPRIRHARNRQSLDNRLL